MHGAGNSTTPLASEMIGDLKRENKQKNYLIAFQWAVVLLIIFSRWKGWFD